MKISYLPIFQSILVLISFSFIIIHDPLLNNRNIIFQKTLLKSNDIGNTFEPFWFLYSETEPTVPFNASKSIMHPELIFGGDIDYSVDGWYGDTDYHIDPIHHNSTGLDWFFLLSENRDNSSIIGYFADYKLIESNTTGEFFKLFTSEDVNLTQMLWVWPNAYNDQFWIEESHRLNNTVHQPTGSYLKTYWNNSETSLTIEQEFQQGENKSFITRTVDTRWRGTIWVQIRGPLFFGNNETVFTLNEQHAFDYTISPYDPFKSTMIAHLSQNEPTNNQSDSNSTQGGQNSFFPFIIYGSLMIILTGLVMFIFRLFRKNEKRISY